MSGLSAEEARLLSEWPEHMQIFEQLRDLQDPLRVADMPAYVRALGIPAEPVFIRSFQGAPMRHRGVQVGNFFLGEKEGGREFTDEDEEVLVLFASQAATAIANARTHRAEQRAPLRPRGRGRHGAERRGGLQCQDRRADFGQSGGQAYRRRPAFCGPTHRGPAERGDMPNRRRTRVRPQRSAAGGSDERRGGGACHGSRALGTRRAAGHDVDQRHAHPLRRGGRRIGGGHHAGPGAARGAGAAAGGVPGHGEPRAARAPDVHQGLDRHGARRLAGPGPGRGPPVPPHHRQAGRSHGRSDQRPVGCGSHRDRHAVGLDGAGGGGRPGGPGQKHLLERRRQASPGHRSAAGPTVGDGPTSSASCRF